MFGISGKPETKTAIYSCIFPVYSVARINKIPVLSKGCLACPSFKRQDSPLEFGVFLAELTHMAFVAARAKITTDNTGAFSEIPVLLTPDGVLEPLMDFCLKHSIDRSHSWMKKLIQAVTLFLQYLNAHPDSPWDYRLFQNFATRLYTGTFDRTTGTDPSGLCWKPFPWDTVGSYITLLTDFFDWLQKMHPGAKELNPRNSGSVFDRRMYEAAYLFRREKAFLGHTWEVSAQSTEVHDVRPKRRPSISAGGDPPAFPDIRFEELLFRGFRVGGKFDYRGMLLSLAMHGAGFRMCEPFHMFVDDVARDPTNANSALLLIHHPSLGYVPGGWEDKIGSLRAGNRAVYLGEIFALAPRDQVMGSKHAGWKNPRLDSKWYMEAYWFEPKFGEWFLQIWPYYLKEIAGLERSHPYAWVNLDREPIGGMYTMSMFEKAHARACERIGLTVSKKLGTTPHGHRHAYGQRLKHGGFDAVLKQRFMHHASPESQETYTQPSRSELQQALRDAAPRLNNSAQRGHPPAGTAWPKGIGEDQS